MLFYKNEQHTVPDYSTKYEHDHYIFLWHIQHSKFMKKGPQVLKFGMEPNSILLASATDGTW